MSVRGYALALESRFEKAHQRKELIFNTTLIKNLHKDIISKDPGFKGVPGMLRRPNKPGSTVIIGGHFRKEDSIYNPAPADHVNSCLAEVMKWFSNSELAQRGDAGVGGMTLPVRLAIGHSHFEAVHPFSDGNGRVGRAIWPLQMVCADYMPLYLSGYVEQEKENYYKVLQLAQKKLKYAPLVDFISTAIINSAKEMEVSKNALFDLIKKWSQRGKFRKGSTAEKSLNLLLKTPIITAKTLKEEMECSFQAASNALKQLSEKGIINERTKQSRNRIFAAEEVIEILSREFASNVELALERGRKLVTTK